MYIIDNLYQDNITIDVWFPQNKGTSRDVDHDINTLVTESRRILFQDYDDTQTMVSLVHCGIPRRVYKLKMDFGRKGTNMRQCMDADNLHRRLNKIQGQIKAIDKMVDEDVPCEEILIQINAAKSALHKAGQVVLEGHLNHCVKEGIEHGDADKTIADFAKAVEQFSRM